MMNKIFLYFWQLVFDAGMENVDFAQQTIAEVHYSKEYNSAISEIRAT